MKCNLCEKYFAFKGDLQKHSKIHNEPSKRIPCSLCDKTFTNNTHLDRHKKLHTSISVSKPFRCDRCELSFREKYNLKVHVERVHDKILKLFECDKCPTKFNGRAKLEHHIELKHEQINRHLRCDDCSKTFPVEHLLRRHKNMVHIVPAHECKICNVAFKSTGKLDRHNSSVTHKNNIFKNAMQMQNKVNITQFR